MPNYFGNIQHDGQYYLEKLRVKNIEKQVTFITWLANMEIAKVTNLSK